MIADRLFLVAYIGLVLGASFLRDPWILASLLGTLLVLALLAGRMLKLLRKTLVVVLFFNVTLSLSYAAFSVWSALPFGNVLFALNLRSLTLTLATFLFFERVPPYRAFSFSRELTHFVVLSVAFVQTYRRLLSESRLSLESRTPVRAGPRVLYRHAATFALLVLRRAERDAQETTLALRSRGLPI